MNVGVTAILLALVAMLGNAEYYLGTSMLSRPIVMGTLAGLVMGDIETGIIIGATLELAFVGSFSIGASIPPEIISGSVLGTAFAIATGKGTGVALSLALPIASIVLIVKNVGFLFIMPPLIHKADEYARQANSKGINLINFLSGFLSVNLPIGLAVGISYAVGSNSVQGLLDAIPEFIIRGLEIGTALLPAYGFALLLNTMINKKNWPFFLLGFALVVYLNISVTGVAIFGAILALILSGYSSFNGGNMMGQNETEGGIDYASEEF